MKMLVADDELNNRILLRKILESYGEVDLVIDGQEAVDAFTLAHAEEAPYDVIFMDIMMPNMDGHKAVQTVRKKEAEMNVPPQEEVKVVMVTALDSAKDAMQAYYRDGCTDYVTKPITRSKIDNVLKDSFGG